MSESEHSTAPLTGAERAAMVLRELGEDVAAAVLRQMDEASIGRISSAMTRMPPVTRDLRDEVMSNFSADLGVAGDNDGFRYVSRVLTSALGEAPAREIMDRLAHGERRSAYHLPINMDPRTVALQMSSERPQTIALFLAHIPHDTGAAILAFMPEALAAEALYRFTALDAIAPGAVVELREMMADLLSESSNGGRRSTDLGGAKQTADILNHLQTGLSERMLTSIAARDGETAGKIRQNLFTFIDLAKLSDRALQVLLREVPPDRLAPALRLVDETIRGRFFQNLSTRMVEVLKEELKSGPPMRRSDALAAQNDIVEVALRLSAEGQISINASEEMV